MKEPTRESYDTPVLIIMGITKLCDSLGIAPIRDCTHFLKVVFVVAGGGFYSYIHQGNKLDKEKKIVRKKLSFMHTKGINTFFKWVQSRVGAIPRLPNFVCIYIVFLSYFSLLLPISKLWSSIKFYSAIALLLKQKEQDRKKETNRRLHMAF